MSDFTAADLGEQTGTSPEGVAPEGQVTPEATEFNEPVGDPTQEPASTEPVAQTFKVTVAGVEQEVTLEDLQSGFMRQADYTRKTQEVAQMRQRLAQAEAIADALDKDPQGTLQALAEAFGVGASSEGFESEEVDPVQARLNELERREQAREAQRVRAQIDTEIDTLLDTYGDFDLQSVIAHAAQNGMTVTAAYRDLNFDTVAQKQRAEAQITEQKREAVVVEGGAHRTGVVEQAKPATSIREAWQMATKSLGR
jgi:hypothetical protein